MAPHQSTSLREGHRLADLSNFSPPSVVEPTPAPEPPSESDYSLALTPDALTALLKIQAPAGAVTLKGIATQVQAFPKDGPPKAYYGRLALGGASVRFHLDPHSPPAVGDHCLIHGVLTIKATDAVGGDKKEWRATHELMLRGSVVGQWQPTPAASARNGAALALRRESGRLPLSAWVEENDLQSLLIIASDEGKPDLWQGLVRAGKAFRFGSLWVGSVTRRRSWSAWTGSIGTAWKAWPSCEAVAAGWTKWATRQRWCKRCSIGALRSTPQWGTPTPCACSTSLRTKPLPCRMRSARRSRRPWTTSRRTVTRKIGGNAARPKFSV